MLHFRKGNHLETIVKLLSVTGEFPVYSLYLLGNERIIKRLVHKLSEEQTIRNYETKEEKTGKVFVISGTGQKKTLRFYKAVLPLMEWIHKDALAYYMDTFQGHKFAGGEAHIQRNHRIGEAVCMFMRAGVEARPYTLSKLQTSHHTDLVGESPAFYISKELKKIGEDEIKKTMFTRLVGAFCAGGACYAVYNTRNASMKWHGQEEFKTLYSLTEIVRMNSKINMVDSAILFGKSADVALKTLMESDKSRRLEFRFDSVYRHIHFVPLNEMGMRLIRIMCLQNWKERLLELLFDSNSRSFGLGAFEYDAKINDTYVISFLGGDIARLVRFRDAIINGSGRYEVLCYPQQMEFLKEFLGEYASIRTIEMEVVEEALGIERFESKRVALLNQKTGKL